MSSSRSVQAYHQLISNIRKASRGFDKSLEKTLINSITDFVNHNTDHTVRWNDLYQDFEINPKDEVYKDYIRNPFADITVNGPIYKVEEELEPAEEASMNETLSCKVPVTEHVIPFNERNYTKIDLERKLRALAK